MIENLTPSELTLIGVAVVVIHWIGIASGFHAVMKCRSSHAAIAWGISLILLPYLALPLYWVFGRAKYYGYVTARRRGELEINHIAHELDRHTPEFGVRLEDQETPHSALEQLVRIPFTRANDARLLIDGEATFAAIFAAIDSAEKYVLVQFFIIRADELGNQLKDRLAAKARSGVRVYVLFDEIGSHGLPGSYVDELRQAGASVHAFKTTQGRGNRFQLNFRNHRKIVVVDGRVAHVGGHNVGDEYLGRKDEVGCWRDTHVEVEGPAVQVTQLAFAEDWYWATREVPDLDWVPRPSSTGDRQVLVFPTGPADELDSCGLFFSIAIHRAIHRVWIASPYFVPDAQVIGALQIAALRGVDVRILLPEKPDHRLVYLAGFSYYAETLPYGVQIFRYQPGFLHQKVMLVDDSYASVGTANLDNRSFRLNFEISMIFADRPFAREVETMLEKDFAASRPVTLDDFRTKRLPFRIAVAFARLFSPIL